jgi:ribosomal protein S6--L-glutamate ligase
MKAAVISLNSKSSAMLIEKMEQYFDEVVGLDIRNIEVSIGTGARGILHKGEPLGEYDCLFVRGSFKYAAIQSAIASQYEDKCYMPTAKEAFFTVHDKLLTHLALEKYNVPMPQTYLSSTPAAAKELLQQITYPIIMKIPNGTHGKGVMFADSFAAATSMLDTLTTLKQPFLIQEYVETNGEDLRLIVIGDKVVASMKRKSSGEDKRSNLHAGGTAESINPSPAMKKAAIVTAKALGVDICGVDILEGVKNPLVIEANLFPGMQGITKATGIDVADLIAKYLSKRTDAFISARDFTAPTTKDILEEEGVDSIDAGNIITTLDFRGERVLLPKLVSERFKEDKDYLVEYSADAVTIKRM